MNFLLWIVGILFHYLFTISFMDFSETHCSHFVWFSSEDPAHYFSNGKKRVLLKTWWGTRGIFRRKKTCIALQFNADRLGLESLTWIRYLLTFASSWSVFTSTENKDSDDDSICTPLILVAFKIMKMSSQLQTCGLVRAVPTAFLFLVNGKPLKFYEPATNFNKLIKNLIACLDFHCFIAIATNN